MKKENTRINCFKCKHFFTTWNPAHPRGCKAYGFKSKHMPSDYVFHSSGQPCMKYEPKQKLK